MSRHLQYRKLIQVQWMPSIIHEERRIVLARIYWNYGTVSHKISISLAFVWQDLWVGAFVRRECYATIVWLCLLPCLPIRFHHKRSYGGSFF